MANWKFWERGDQELGLPSMSSSNSGLDFAQHYEPPAAEPFGASSMPSLPPLSAPGQYPQTNNANSFQPSAFGQMQQTFPPPEEHAQSSSHSSKDLEVITAKLDAVRAQLETMNLRLSAIEQRLPPQTNDPNNPRRPWY